jgi:hypothetical protein
MLETVFWLLVGAFVGWNLPQPQWAQRLQEKTTEIFRNFWNK